MPDLIERAHADGVSWSAHARVDKFELESLEQCRFDLGLDREPTGPELLDWAERTRGQRAGDEVVEVDGNTMTRLGRHRLWDRYIGTASNQALDATHMRIGVGDSNTAAADTDTDLGASAGSTHRQFNLVNAVATIGAGGSSGVLTAVATFATTDANFHWQEWGLDGGTGAGTTVTTDGNTTPGLQNHKVTDLGTKTSAASWVFTVTLTVT